jgi:hypothetical protein
VPANSIYTSGIDQEFGIVKRRKFGSGSDLSVTEILQHRAFFTHIYRRTVASTVFIRILPSVTAGEAMLKCSYACQYGKYQYYKTVLISFFGRQNLQRGIVAQPPFVDFHSLW